MSEKKKKMYMWFWVIGITVIIGIVWIASVKYNINTSILSIASKKDKGLDQQAIELRKSLGKELQEMKKVFSLSDAVSTINSTTSTQ